MTLLLRLRISLGDLARLAGEDVDALRRTLRGLGVPLHKLGGKGRKLWLYPDDLAMHAPEIYRGISRRESVAKVASR